MIGEDDQKLVKLRHDSIAAAVLPERDSVDAKIEAQNRLCGAAIVGNLSIIKSSLERNKIDVNGRTPYFYSPLTLAVSQGYLSIVRYLLDRGARFDSVAGKRYRILGLICQADWNSTCEGEWCASLTEDSPSALRSAVLNGHGVIVVLLLQSRYRLDITSLEYLRAVLAGARAGRVHLIKRLLNVIGRDISDFAGLGNEMLWEATRYGQENVVQWLLDNGIDINVFPQCMRNARHSALQIVASLGNINMAHFLLERGGESQSLWTQQTR